MGQEEREEYHHLTILSSEEGCVARQKRTEPFDANEDRKYCQNTLAFSLLSLETDRHLTRRRC